jgi:Patatin-like phospholipase
LPVGALQKQVGRPHHDSCGITSQHRRSWCISGACFLLLAQLVVGCAALERQPAVPASLTEQAMVLGIPNARFWPDTQGPALIQEGTQALMRERAARAETAGTDAALPPANFLAVSGGGDNGAFAAGLLIGWTDTDTRPVFKLVTGISTGALVAPFAFLGPAYDQQLRTVYTSIGPQNVYVERGLLKAVFSESLADTTPLFQLISHYVDANLLAAIANEYQKGRLLMIATTDIDAERPVIWNIGAIAASGRPEAPDLIRKILLASAAMPGFFPPVLFDVEAAGRQYQEMHVDGGAVAQTFLYPPQIGTLVNLRQGPYARERHAYVIRSGRLDPEWASVDRRLMSISGRAISTMIHYSGYNDILRIYSTTQRDGVDYNLAYIEPDFTVEHREDFDPVYMKALYDYGYQKAIRGYPWHKAPPNFAPP